MVIQFAVVAARAIAQPLIKVAQAFSKAAKQVSKVTSKIKKAKKSYGKFSDAQKEFKGRIGTLKNSFKRLNKIMKGLSLAYNIMTKVFKLALGLLTACFGSPQLQGALARIKLEAELIAWKIGNKLAPIFESLSDILHAIRVGDWQEIKEGVTSLLGNISDLFSDTVTFIKDKILKNGILGFFKNAANTMGEAIGNRLVKMFPSLSTNYIILWMTNKIERKSWHILLAPFIPIYLIYWFVKTRDITFGNLVQPIVNYIKSKKEWISNKITTGINNILIGAELGKKLWDLGKEKIFDYLIPIVLNKLPGLKFMYEKLHMNIILKSIFIKYDKLIDPDKNSMYDMSQFYKMMGVVMPKNHFTDFAVETYEARKLLGEIPDICGTLDLYSSNLNNVDIGILNLKKSQVKTCDTIYNFHVSGQSIEQPNIYLKNIGSVRNFIRADVANSSGLQGIELYGYFMADNIQYLNNNIKAYEEINFADSIVTVSKPFMYPNVQPEIIKIKVLKTKSYSDMVGGAYQVGGTIPFTGLHYVHAGERIIPLGATDKEEKENVLTIDVTDDIVINHDNDIRKIVDQYIKFS